jgi:hypothetical protein
LLLLLLQLLLLLLQLLLLYLLMPGLSFGYRLVVVLDRSLLSFNLLSLHLLPVDFLLVALLRLLMPLLGLLLLVLLPLRVFLSSLNFRLLKQSIRRFALLEMKLERVNPVAPE